MAKKQKKRALDVGTGPRLASTTSDLTPCSIELDMALMKLPKAQRNQLKPLLINCVEVFTSHIDRLHQELQVVRGQTAIMARMLLEHDDRVRHMPRECPDCGMAEEYVLAEGCCGAEHALDGTACTWHGKRVEEAKANDAERQDQDAPGEAGGT